MEKRATKHKFRPITASDSVYTLLTDRFADGDPSNNDLGHGEYDVTNPYMYHGGDIQGVIDQLDYIQGMGFTVICISPVVQNYWSISEEEGEMRAAYHGYWAYDFSKIDPHIGDLAKLIELREALHARGMKLMIDVVMNHLSPNKVIKDYRYPSFEWGHFHHTGNIKQLHEQPDKPCDCDPERTPWDCDWAVHFGDIADLADLDTANDYVRDTLADQHAAYLDAIGADGMRLDSVKHIPKSDWVALMKRLRRKLKQGDSRFTIGEVFVTDHEQDHIACEIGKYTLPDARGDYPMNSVLNFGLYDVIKERLFEEGASTLAEVYRQQFHGDHYQDPYTLGNFVDNHDVPRFLGEHEDNWEKLRLVLTLIFSWPGIPWVYYGTEQACSDGGKGDPLNRPNLWEVGFNRGHDFYVHLQRLNALRHGETHAGEAMRHGQIHERMSEGPLYVFERIHRDSKLLVMINTSRAWQRISDLQTSLPGGLRREMLYGLKTVRIEADGRLMDYDLAPNEILILSNDTTVIPDNDEMPALSLRGTHNQWGLTPMVYEPATGRWSIRANFSTVDAAFKFDIYGDWVKNFGGGQTDHAHPAGCDIPVTAGIGCYRISFNPNDKTYQLEKLN